MPFSFASVKFSDVILDKLAEIGEPLQLFAGFTRSSPEHLVMPQDEVLTLKEVASLLKIAERTTYMMVQRGNLPGFKVGGQWRFKRVDIDNWIEVQKREGKPLLKEGNND